MRSKIPFLLLVLLLGVVMTVAPSMRIVEVNAQDTKTERQAVINVSGEALVRVVPDEVSMTFGIETTNKDLAAAKQENDDRIRAILSLADRHEIARENVRTDFIWIEPRYKDYYRREIDLYIIRKTVVFTLKDIAKFEALLTDAIALGVDNVFGIDFRTTELRKYRDQARDLAVKAAREKAEAMAGALGEKIGRPISIHEDQLNWYSYYSYYWRWYGGYGSGSGGQMSQNVIQSVGGNAPLEGDGAFAPGQISVSARVTVQFELVN